jgi:hypothetical protein
MNKNAKIIVAIIVVLVLAGGAFAMLNAPDNRTAGEHIGDAVDSLSEGEGLDDAARELEDRTPAERMGDAVEDATDGNVE